MIIIVVFKYFIKPIKKYKTIIIPLYCTIKMYVLTIIIILGNTLF